MVEQYKDDYVSVNRQLRNRVVAQTVSGKQKRLASAVSGPSYREVHSSDTTDSEEDARTNSHKPRYPVAAQEDVRNKTATEAAQRNEGHNLTGASEQEKRGSPSKAAGASQNSRAFIAKLKKFKLKTNLEPVVKASKNRSLLSPLQGAFSFPASASETEPATGARVEEAIEGAGAQAGSPTPDVSQQPIETSASTTRDCGDTQSDAQDVNTAVRRKESMKAASEEQSNRDASRTSVEPTTPIK